MRSSDWKLCVWRKQWGIPQMPSSALPEPTQPDRTWDPWKASSFPAGWWAQHSCLWSYWAWPPNLLFPCTWEADCTCYQATVAAACVLTPLPHPTPISHTQLYGAGMGKRDIHILVWNLLTKLHIDIKNQGYFQCVFILVYLSDCFAWIKQSSE